MNFLILLIMGLAAGIGLIALFGTLVFPTSFPQEIAALEDVPTDEVMLDITNAGLPHHSMTAMSLSSSELSAHPILLHGLSKAKLRHDLCFVSSEIAGCDRPPCCDEAVHTKIRVEEARQLVSDYNRWGSHPSPLGSDLRDYTIWIWHDGETYFIKIHGLKIEGDPENKDCNDYGDGCWVSINNFLQEYNETQNTEQSFKGTITYDYDDNCRSPTLQRCVPYKLNDIQLYGDMQIIGKFKGQMVEVVGKRVQFDLEGHHLDEIWPIKIRYTG